MSQADVWAGFTPGHVHITWEVHLNSGHLNTGESKDLVAVQFKKLEAMEQEGSGTQHLPKMESSLGGGEGQCIRKFKEVELCP